jgi:hypothetical protein
MNRYISILSMCLFCLSLCKVAHAQKLNVNKGSEYKIITMMSSTMAMKRGNKQLDFTSMSAVTKSYRVTEANDAGYKLAITTDKITDTITGFDQKLAYSSVRAADPNSAIETELSKMVGQTQTLSLDKAGKITQIDDMKKANKDAKIASATGLYHKSLVVGYALNFGANLKLPADAKKGTMWTDEASNGGKTSKTDFKVEEVKATTTRVSLIGNDKEPGISTAAIGELIIDNATGVVLHRIIKSTTVSNVGVGDKSYLTARKNLISEYCIKVK